MEQRNWKGIILVGGLGLSAFMVLASSAEEQKFWSAIAIASLMVLYWIFEVIPIYVTALFPLIFAVPLGVLDTKLLAECYGHNIVFLFFGGFVLSLALEKWDVHQRVAEMIIRTIGNSKSRILLGFLVSTALLSMWISNTATALMMLPMAVAVIEKIPTKQHSRFPLYLLLAIAYGASVGGMATIVGSPPNAAMVGLLDSNELVTDKVSFMDWFAIGLPVSIVMLILIYLFFYLKLGKERKTKLEELTFERIPWTANQIRVLLLFLLVVILWSFKAFIEPWLGIKYGDEVPAVLGAILLFIVPSKEKGKMLLEWKDTRKMAWGILLLFGGGMALAKMMEVNGVIVALAEVFEKYQGLSIGAIILILVALSTFGTEVMSNLALVQVMVPLVAVFALNSDNYSVIQLCIPVTLAASCAFMLPVSTPPNAIIFSSGKVTVNQMAKVGFVLNLAGIVVITLFSIFFLG